MKLTKLFCLQIFLSPLFLLVSGPVYAQGTAFTYQGRLDSGGAPANGVYDLAFTLFATNTGGAPVSSSLTNFAVGLSNGLFITTIDFGRGIFTGSNYWLELAVRTNGAVTFSELSPRQSLTATPYAVMAGNASNLLGNLPAGQLSGSISPAQLPGAVITNGETGVALSGSFAGNGAGLTNLNATNLAGTLPINILPLQLTSWLTGQNFNGYQILGGAPEYAQAALTPSLPGQLALVYNSAITAYYTSRSTVTGDWNGSAMFNGSLQVGTQTNMPPSEFTGAIIWANGNPVFQSTNGSRGTELTLTLAQPDPKQATYINFSAPAGGNGAANIIMSNPQDCQIGIGGWVYGTNTLNGVAIANDMLIAMNPGHNLIFTTTVDAGNYGCRAFLEYDNANSAWHIPLDVVGNGALGNPGYGDLAVFDARQRVITMTNASINLGTPNSGVPALSIDNQGNVSLPGNNITVGGDVAGTAGRGNTGNISGGSLWLNNAGTANYSTLSFGAELDDLNRVPFINEDSDGNLQIGIYPNGTMQAFDVNGRFVDLGPAVAINTTNAPRPSALLDLNTTTNKGLLLMNLTKAQRNAIFSPVAGLMIYQTDNTPGLRTYNGANWVRYTEITD